MSFYVYYGKLENELLVAVLPNGTIEHDDLIYLYSKRKFSSYRAKDVSVTEDGEDLFTFNDGYHSYQALSKKAYKELSLTVKHGNGTTAKVALTRHYDQPLTAIPLSDQPKIWTGAISFHEWAKNESFIAIAPKGLGNGKPVVSLWQWTKDASGVQRTLSYSTGKQESEAANPTAFSFKQGNYYTLNCKVNPATNGLYVTIMSPANPDAVQGELVLSAKVELGAEHRFAPPRPAQHQITLDCSLPRAAPSLPRITGALPFPADLVETLSYSAAYVDQAGYLAKYAVKQFNQLDKSYHQLEKKSEARAEKVATLEGEVSRLGEANHLLESRNTKLQKQLVENRRIAEERQTTLEKQLQEALTALTASQSLANELEAYIDADKLADIERERKHHEHDAADHKAIDLANKALKKSHEVERQLQKTLEEKNHAITTLEASLKFSQDQLSDNDALIRRLKAELSVEKIQRAETQKKLEEETYDRKAAEKNLEQAQKDIKAKDATATKNKAEIERQKNIIKETDEAHTEVKKDRDIKAQELEDLENEKNKAINELRDELATLKSHDRSHHVSTPKSNVTAGVTEIVA